MSARVVDGLLVDDVTGQVLDVAVRCTRCGEFITGCRWNGGRCFDCHQATLLPPERWGDDGTPWDEDDPTATPTTHPVTRW